MGLMELALALKYRSHLVSASAWQSAFDSGVLAFPSMFVMLAMMLVSLSLAGIGVMMLIGYASLDRWGILTAAIFVVTLLLTWNSAATAGSWLEYAQQLSLLLACAGTGVVTGLRLRPGRRDPRHPHPGLRTGVDQAAG